MLTCVSFRLRHRTRRGKETASERGGHNQPIVRRLSSYGIFPAPFLERAKLPTYSCRRHIRTVSTTQFLFRPREYTAMARENENPKTTVHWAVGGESRRRSANDGGHRKHRCRATLFVRGGDCGKSLRRSIEELAKPLFRWGMCSNSENNHHDCK